jgi:putative transcriptional regulator
VNVNFAAASFVSQACLLGVVFCNANDPEGPGEEYRARYLDGQMLIATPSMSDERFTRTVVYVCAHSSEGAMGIVVNQPAANIDFPDLLVKLKVLPATI